MVSNQNQEAFVEKVLFLIRNSEIRKQMGQQALKNVQRFSPDLVMRRWKELIADTP